MLQDSKKLEKFQDKRNRKTEARKLNKAINKHFFKVDTQMAKRYTKKKAQIR